MQSPTVTFVVPCYKLSHLLGECLNSILAQTYGDFEVLIMDDCSPDNTAEVAASFHDARVRHVRNNPNLGHLRNYNKGIQMAEGKYVWLISADDYLRRPYLLERYVQIMEQNPRVGYVFCPGVGVRDGSETEVLDYSVYSDRDLVVNGHEVLRRLFDCNIVVAASAMVRRECYEKLGAFPLDAQWAGERVDFGWNGDWYLWCLFALFYDVAYFAEPMVCYREHNLSMTNFYTNEDNVQRCLTADIGMLWLIREAAMKGGFLDMSKDCLRAIANEYVRHVTSKQYRQAASSMDIAQFEQSLSQSLEDQRQKEFVRSHFMTGMANRARMQGDLRTARKYYLRSIRHCPWALKLYLKLFLVALGRPGDYVYRALRSLRGATTTAFTGQH